MRFSRSILLSLMACRLAFAVGPRCDQADQLLCAKGGNGVYDVKSFGAVGDGTANDTSALAAAATAAGANGILYFPCGTYRITRPKAIVVSQAHWTGAGQGAYRNLLYDLRLLTIAGASNVGLELNGTSSINGANSTRIFGGYIRADGGKGVWIPQGDHVVVDGVVFEGGTSLAVHVQTI